MLQLDELSVRNFTTVLVIMLFLLSCEEGNTQKDTAQYTNALINENSPYLLQHVHNPVNWYPWGEEALSKAKRENKLLIISIGYAACHWCHVMEKESFEDTTVARIMNENFVAIKVDREERPDVDDVYMSACQLASEKGCGWPLNAFALPNGQPVYAGTYYPKKEWMRVMNYFVDVAQKDRQKLEEYAQQLTEGIQSMETISLNEATPDFKEEDLKGWNKKFISAIDAKKGGRKGAPKFPIPNNYEYLLKYAFQFDDEQSLQIVQTTLDHIARGGIYDQIGGGFSRYSTDAEWHVPHFEKMLYDNAQLVSLYAQAYRWSKNPLYQQVVEETLTFIERSLTSTEGGFFSSLDADSEGVEGQFYVWTQAEVQAIIEDKEKANLIFDYFNISAKGNWEGVNVLRRMISDEAFAQEHDLSIDELQAIVKSAKKALLAVRSNRVPPGLDDKVLTSWNALMISGYVEAYKAFGDESYLEAAIKNADFLSANLQEKDKRLYRNYKNGRAAINGFLDDYAHLIQAFTHLYEVTFDEKWLVEAKATADYALAYFYDSEVGMFNYTSKLDAPLVAKNMEVTDNVIPASNSTMARNLFKLGLYFYDQSYLEQSKQLLNNVLQTIQTSNAPSFYSNWLQLYIDQLKPPYEVAILGHEAPEKLNTLTKFYLPNTILLGGKTEGNLSLLKNKLQEGETWIYVCQDKVCKFPVQEVEAALELIK